MGSSTSAPTTLTGAWDAERLQRRLSAMVAAANDAIYSVSAHDRRVETWNLAAERLYGYGAGEIIGRVFDELVPAESGEAYRSLLARAARGERTDSAETHHLHKAGHRLDIAWTVAPVRSEETGAVDSFVMVATDVGPQRRYAEELERSNRELEQFAYVASHDLSEPLRAIAGFVQLLERRYAGQLGADADRWIGNTVDSTARMRRLIDDLLAYSRVGRSRLTRRDVAVGELVAEVIETLAPAIDQSGARVVVDPLPTLCADAGQLAQVFQNLLGNALKFRADVAPAITISAWRADRAWCLSVADNGIGVEPRHRERVFEVFRRLHARSRYPGTGIGLAICQRIVEGHGGTIWVETSAAGGSDFRFTIPDVEGER